MFARFLKRVFLKWVPPSDIMNAGSGKNDNHRSKSIVAAVSAVLSFVGTIIHMRVNWSTMTRRDLYPHFLADAVVQRFISHTFGPAPKHPLLIRVRWLGYDAAHDTDKPATSLVQDVPDMVEEYLRRNKNEPACARMLKRYFK